MNVVKWIGAVFIFLCCTGLGWQIATAYRNRPKQLRMLSHGIRLLQAEVEYHVTPLPVALSKVADKVSEPIRQLFRETAEVLGDPEKTVNEALAAGMESIRHKSALYQTDFEVIREFGNTLGSTDRIHQSQQFRVALTQLDGVEHDALDQQKRNERLWQYMGVLSGLLIVVLMY